MLLVVCLQLPPSSAPHFTLAFQYFDQVSPQALGSYQENTLYELYHVMCVLRSMHCMCTLFTRYCISTVLYNVLYYYYFDKIIIYNIILTFFPCTVLYCIVLYSIVLYSLNVYNFLCTVLCCTYIHVLHSIHYTLYSELFTRSTVLYHR